jgi:hypothetical protein
MKDVLFGMNLIALISLIGFISLGVWDLYRLYLGIPTITSIVREKFQSLGKAWAVVLFCVIVGIIWWLLGANSGVLAIGVGVLGHLTLWE